MGRFTLSRLGRAFSLGAVAISGLALVFGGCSKPDGKAGGDGHDHAHSHAHPTVAPHNGMILEWGRNHEHHLEIVFDREKQQATVYFLDHDMKKTEATALVDGEVRIMDAENSVQIPLVASPLEGETAEKSSRYVATHAALGSKEPLTGDVRGQVGGIDYLDSFARVGESKAATPGDKKADEKKADGDKHDAHEGHDHDGDKHDAHDHDAHDHDAHDHDAHDEHAHEAETKGAGKKEEHGHDDHAHDEHTHEEHGPEAKPAEPKKDGEQPKADADEDHKHAEGHEHDHDAHDHDHDHEHGADEKKPAADAAPKG